MTAQQSFQLLYSMHTTPIGIREQKILSILKRYSNNEEESSQEELAFIRAIYDTGIGKLNANQLSNLLNLAKHEELDINEINRRLNFYGVDVKYHQNITQFLKDSIISREPIDVENLDKVFKGVQVASRDEFDTVINQGWTGDWDLTPNNIEPMRVQIASMNEDGDFPRGCYLNADIVKIEPIQHADKVRYRLHIANPIVIDTGNRNVRFTSNPVRHIR